MSTFWQWLQFSQGTSGRHPGVADYVLTLESIVRVKIVDSSLMEDRQMVIEHNLGECHFAVSTQK